jgi:hypothetical protein
MVGIVAVMARYFREIRAAREQLAHLGSQVIETACGPIEYARVEDGYPVLVVHGARRSKRKSRSSCAARWLCWIAAIRWTPSAAQPSPRKPIYRQWKTRWSRRSTNNKDRGGHHDDH